MLSHGIYTNIAFFGKKSYIYRQKSLKHNKMKKLILLLAALALSSSMLSAQVAPGMKYNELKGIYNPVEYVHTANDPYSPGWSGFASFVVPGLGQVICGETGRGLAFFGSSLLVGTVGGGICAANILANVNVDENGTIVSYKNEAAARQWSFALMGIGMATLALDIWSIVDAVKVAKVRNMYNQDLLSNRAMQMQLRPSMDLVRTASGFQPAPGVTFAMQF